jgi:propionyl-CoA carboxylase alpha chain
MGFRTVAIYSDVDINSLHVAMADETVLIGNSMSSDSYLNITKIVNTCKKLGVKYVHPGWGFLSENYHFVEALEADGIIFVGPSSKSIKLIGDKISSKVVSQKVGVNIAQTSEGSLKDANEAIKFASKVNYPIILKASSGGGGKGIRVVYNVAEMNNAFDSVKNEAKNSFGDDRIFAEKYIEEPKHIEVQILGDKQGNIVYLGERDCSIQRNKQKIIEETPCPILDEKTREKMFTQAVALAKEVGYFSVGTLEFLLDEDKNFYFMEMNTRLQVEHTITEMVTGLDLVEQMLLVAQNKPLSFTQKDINIKGWAMECRINAEDPSRNFLPSSGRISKYIEPEKIDGVRVDTGVYEGYSVSMFYDNMLSKLIVHGNDRKDVIEKMQNALGSYYIDGISVNTPFLEAIMYNDRFREGNFNIDFLKKEFSGGFASSVIDSREESVLISASLYIYLLNSIRFNNISGQVVAKNRLEQQNSLVCDVNGNRYLCKITKGNNVLSVDYGIGFAALETNWYFGNNIFRATINDKLENIKILSDNKTGDIRLQYMGNTFNVLIRSSRISELEKYIPTQRIVKKPKYLKAPITGKIVKMMVKIDDEIKIGEELLIIEAMKMENIIRAEYDCFIKDIKYKSDDLVYSDDIIIEFEY